MSTFDQPCSTCLYHGKCGADDWRNRAYEHRDGRDCWTPGYKQIEKQSENKCDCYHIEHGMSVCWGTKECETCTCGGDTLKCNFYPEKRQEPKPKTEPKVKECATLLKQYYNALMAEGFTGSQAFQIVLEYIKSNAHGGKA